MVLYIQQETKDINEEPNFEFESFPKSLGGIDYV